MSRRDFNARDPEESFNGMSEGGLATSFTWGSELTSGVSGRMGPDELVQELPSLVDESESELPEVVDPPVVLWAIYDHQTGRPYLEVGWPINEAKKELQVFLQSYPEGSLWHQRLFLREWGKKTRRKRGDPGKGS